jgi:hypothetical protein
MKKIILLLSLSIIPLSAGPYCIDNSQHLQKPYDDKEWHSVACACDCTTIKGGHCADCGHMQNARTYTIVEPQKMSNHSSFAKATADTAKTYIPENPQDALKKLAAKYVKNRYDV